MIGAGIPNPLMLLNGGDPLDELGKIDKSLRLRAAASAYLSRSPATTTSQLKWTFSGWFKRGDIGAGGTIISAGISANDLTNIGFTGTDEIVVTHLTGALGYNHRITLAKFRDPAAWMHVVVVWDTANAVASDRIIIYVNGVRQTCTEITIAQNTTSWINTTQGHRINTSIAFGGYCDRYVAAHAFIDGQALDPTSFGKFHPRTGQWRPKSRAAIKAVVDAGGVNSFFLPFDDATSLATLTADASAKGNNWTANNISLTAGATYDSMLDTPTNNFCVLNPLVKRWSNNTATITDGSLRTANTSISNDFAFGSLIPASGKWYFECLVSSVGGAPANFSVGVDSTAAQSLVFADVVQYIATGQSSTAGAAAVAYGASYTTNDVIGVALDRDAGQVTFYKNNVSQGTLTLPTSAPLTAFITPGTSSGVAIANFGQRPFTYTPPTGFKALSTKNLPIKPAGPMKSTDAFVAKTDTGANIVATLAAAAPFANWIKIYKRRDAAEGWRWQFSDDAANYMDSSSTAAKAAFPALSGSSYVGYALNVSAGNGIATGRLTHVNGVADVVTDGLANVRKAIILKNEDTGNWFFYHPDLTAGKLLYINNSANGETTDATISSVTASGFTVAAALVSGTYRWIALAEVDGFLKLGKYIGNGSADGPFANSSFCPAFALIRRTDSGDNWAAHDVARNASNVVTNYLNPNSTAIEFSSAALDITSNGKKIRNTGTGENAAGGSYIYLDFAAFPFRYANAR